MTATDFSKETARTVHSRSMTNNGWGLTSGGILSIVAIAAGGSAIVACTSRVDIAKDEQGATGDGGSTGGAGSGTGGATSETGGATSETGGATAATGGKPSTGGASPGSGGSGPSDTCYSPTQNLNIAYEPGAVGCACNPGDQDVCVSSVALICTDGKWQAVEDGPCMPTFHPAVACSAAPDPGPCFAYMPSFYFDPESKTCKGFDYGGCQGNANRYVSLEDCEETCTKHDNLPVAVIAASSCAGYGEQVSGPGTPEFTTQGFTVSRSESWGCGCATRPEFVMTYQLDGLQRIALRLCHDEGADLCEALCTKTLTYELSGLPPSIAADFVFPAP